MKRRKTLAAAFTALAWASTALAQVPPHLDALPMVLVVPQQSPYRSVDDLIAAARKKPDSIVVGSANPAASAKVQQMGVGAGVRWILVPYRSSGFALADLGAGQVHAAMVTLSAAEAQLGSGALRVLPVQTLEKQTDIPKDML